MKPDFDWFRVHHEANMERMFAAVSNVYADHSRMKAASAPRLDSRLSRE